MKADPKLMAYALAGAAGLYLAYKLAGAAGKGLQVVSDTAQRIVTEDLNPASADNLAYRGVNAVGSAVSGDSSWSLGSWLYDLTHDDPLANPAQASIDRYNRPGTGSGARSEVPTPAPVSFFPASDASFKDLADASGLNAFWNPATYGGGFILH